MRSVVLDASALLAVVFDEPGASVVVPKLDEAVISTVNFEEVLSKMLHKGDTLENALADLISLPVECVPFSSHHAEIAASLRPLCYGASISQADRICMALGIDSGFPILTADRDWADLGLGIPLELIR